MLSRVPNGAAPDLIDVDVAVKRQCPLREMKGVPAGFLPHPPFLFASRKDNLALQQKLTNECTLIMHLNEVLSHVGCAVSWFLHRCKGKSSSFLENSLYADISTSAAVTQGYPRKAGSDVEACVI